MASRTVMMAVAVLGLLGIFAVVTTVTNVNGNGSAYNITDRYEPAIGLMLLNSSTVNVNTPNFNGTYGFKVLNNRITEVKKGGFARPDFIVTSDTKETKDSIPDSFWSLIGPSNRINIAIAMNDGTEAMYGATASETVIEDVNVGGYDNADYTIRTDEGTILEIANTTKPSNATETMYKEGRIRIVTNDFVRNVKLFIADTLFRLFG